MELYEKYYFDIPQHALCGKKKSNRDIQGRLHGAKTKLVALIAPATLFITGDM